MPKEIERKFLIESPVQTTGYKAEKIVQSYLDSQKIEIVVAVTDGSGHIEIRFSEQPFSYPIPVNEANLLIQHYCKPGTGNLDFGIATPRTRVSDDTKGFLTIKGPSIGAECDEFEWSIPVDDALFMIANLRTGRVIEKTRYEIPLVDQGFVAQLDVFAGYLAGLVTVEVEFDYKDQPFVVPSWFGREVTEDFRYKNARLSKLNFLHEISSQLPRPKGRSL